MAAVRSSPGRVLIIGAGPCGLACARELERLGHRDWLILEARPGAGGLARSVLDPAGFTWDLGGHVVFSHFGEFDALLHEALGDELEHHERSSYVRCAGRWVPYPFQNNLRHLPARVRDECLQGLAAAPGASPTEDFATWMRGTFGTGITKHFMAPYNLKVWAHAAETMSAGWIGERVALIDHRRALRNVLEERDEPGWGPNNLFSFPRAGGTGEIYRRIAVRLQDRIRFGTAVGMLDTQRGLLFTGEGDPLAYDALVSTMPLDRLVETLCGAPDRLHRAARELRHNGVFMVGVGYEAPLRDSRSWMYFPDPQLPFYRVTNFAKYAAANVPSADTSRFCSYMTESAFSEEMPICAAGLEARVEAGLRAGAVVEGRPAVASLHTEQIDYAYPVPTLGRDAALAVIQPWLMEQGILSRGRFGSWCYEIGNMDHAVKMGIDAARGLLTGAPEELWRLRGSAPSPAD